MRPGTGRMAACAVGVLVAAAGCGGSAASPQARAAGRAADEGPREVRMAAAAEDHLVRTVQVTGTLAAEEQVVLSLKVTGRLEQLLVDLGSRVTRGQPVARLVPTDFTLRVSQAEAALAQARARLGLSPQGDDDTVDPARTAIVRSAQAVLHEARLTRDRTQTFVTRGIAARADLEAADAALQVADSRYQDAMEEVRNRQAILEQRRTELELARQALRDSTLTSPLDGMVRERHTSEGQYVAAGSPVVTVVRVHPLRLRVAIPEREAHAIRVGQEVSVSVEGDPTVHPGRVARVSPAIDESSRSLMVEAEVPNPRGDLRPGSFAGASIVTATRDKAVLVPTGAVTTFAGVEKVLVVRDGKVAERPVTTGRRTADRTEIVTGLSAGEAVIAEPGNLVEGTAVRVVGDAVPASETRR